MLRTFYCDVLRVVLQFTAKQCFFTMFVVHVFTRWWFKGRSQYNT